MNRLLTIALCAALLWPILCESAAPDLVEQYFRKGYEASMAREWEEAIKWYNKSIALKPDNPDVLFQRAVCMEMLNRAAGAVTDYEKVLQLRPDNYLAMEYLAKLYEKQGKYPQAAALYKKALPLVRDGKWRSIVRRWLSDAQKKIKADTKNRRHGKKALGEKPLY